MSFRRSVRTVFALAAVLLATGLPALPAFARASAYVQAAPTDAPVPTDARSAFTAAAVPTDAAPASTALGPAHVEDSLHARAALPSTALPASEFGASSPSASSSALGSGVSSASISAAQLRSRLLCPETRRASPAAVDNRRSVPLAFGLSVLVPGLGQAYNRSWIRSAVAIGVETGLVIGYLVWKSRGQEREDAYKAYAHQYWDPGRYAAWLNDYVDFLEREDGASFAVDDIPIPNQIDFTSPGSWSPAERQAVRAFFDEVRAVEDVVYHPETGAAFSHNLPYFAEQQYYELIGKYFQFAPGWLDYPTWRQGDAFTEAIDPELTGPGGAKPNVQGRFLEYAKDHAEANTLLRHASRATAFLVLNHIVAAFDAAISAKLHNDRIDADLALGHDRLERAQLTASLTVRL